ncbi:helix-turn-helix domain-containing protein [Pseudomonadota bacterium]
MAKDNQQDKLLTIREAAEILKVNPETLRRWDRSGKLKPIRVGERRGGGDRKYRLEDIQATVNPKKRQLPAQYPIRSATEGRSVSILNDILLQHGLWPEIKWNDKTSNGDGFVDLLSILRIKVGMVEVQVKTLGKNRINRRVSYRFNNRKYFAHCGEATWLPQILIGVDIEKRRAFWKLMTQDVCKGKSKTVYFSTKDIIGDKNTDYIGEWKKIYEKWVQTRIPLVQNSYNQILYSLVSDIRDKFPAYEALLYLVSPVHRESEEVRNGIKEFLELSTQQEELFISELIKQRNVYQAGDIFLFDDELGREKLSYSIREGLLNVEHVYNYFPQLKVRKLILQKLVEVSEQKEVLEFLGKVSDDFFRKVGKLPNNDDIYSNLTLLEVYSYVVPETTLKIIKNLVSGSKPLPPKKYKGAFGSVEGRNNKDLLLKSIEILRGIRYTQPQAVFEILLELSNSDNVDIKKKAIESIEALSKYNLFVLKRVGYAPQNLVLGELESYSESQINELSEVVLEICREMLKPSFEGQKMKDYRTFTWYIGPLVAGSGLENIRKRVLDILQVLYGLQNKVAEKEETLRVMGTASSLPVQGEYGQSMKDMILHSTEKLIDFYIEILPTAENEEIKEIEKQLSWIRKRFTESKLPRLKILKKEIFERKDYQTFRVFFGYDYDYEKELDWRKSKALREKKIDQFVKDVNRNTYKEWVTIVKKVVKNYSDVNFGKYHSFNDFLHKLGKQNPKIALKLLKELEKELVPFMVHILVGVWESKERKLLKVEMQEWIKKGKYLSMMASLFFFVDEVDIGIVGGIFNKAKATKDVETINTIVRLVSNKYNGEEKLKTFYIQGINLLTKTKSTKWTFIPLRNIEVLIDSLTNKEIEDILSNLVFAESISHDIEDILSMLAKKNPQKVIDYFEKRITYRLKQGKETRYDAVPFSFHELKDVLSEKPDVVIPRVMKWFENKDWFYRWEGSQFIKNIFGSFNSQLEKTLLAMIASGDNAKAEAVLMVLRAYKGEPFLHKVCKAFIKKFLRNETGENYKAHKSEMVITLSQTGVVSGEYGMRDAYKQKKLEIQSWKTDRSKTIQKFVSEYEDYLDKSIVQEKKRAEEQIELMKRSVI